MSNSRPKTSHNTNHMKRKGSKKESLSEELSEKVEAVRRVADWPVEDILVVLEKANYDPQIAINNILDGYEKPPTEWEEVVSKRSKQAEQVKQKPFQKSAQQKTSKGQTGGNAKIKKETEKKGEIRKKTPRVTEKENGGTKNRMEGKKQETTPNVQSSAASVPTANAPQGLSGINPSPAINSTSVTNPSPVTGRSFATSQKSWAAIAQPVSPTPPPKTEISSQTPKVSQPSVSTSSQEPLLPSPPAASENVKPSPSPSSPSLNRQYQPPGMKWKPKGQKATPPISSKPESEPPAVTLPVSSMKMMGLDDNIHFGSVGSTMYTKTESQQVMSQSHPTNVSETSPPLDENQMPIQNPPYPYVHGNHYMPPFAPHFAPFEPSDAMRMPMYDQTFQQNFQGEGSDGKFPPQAVPNPREGKFPPQESGVPSAQSQGQPPQGQPPQGQPPQGYFPGQPFYYPIQFSQQFAYPPRFFRNPYPNYSNNSSGFATSSMSGYPEEMMPEFNKGMFPMGSFLPENGGNPSNQTQPKQQSYSPPPSAPSATDLNPANFKPQQIPPTFQQHQSFYNQQQQFGQSQQHWKQQQKQF